MIGLNLSPERVNDADFPWRCPACKNLLLLQAEKFDVHTKNTGMIEKYGIGNLVYFTDSGIRETCVTFICKCRTEGEIKISWRIPIKDLRDPEVRSGLS
jgi:hypothetical protein